MAHDSTDELRLAVKEVICDNSGERKFYEEALIAITVDESLKRYPFPFAISQHLTKKKMDYDICFNVYLKNVIL